MFSINIMNLFSSLKYLKYNEKMYDQVEWCKKIHIADANKFGLMFNSCLNENKYNCMNIYLVRNTNLRNLSW
jgi:hypothetical protein